MLLYRPVGQKELDLIKENNWEKFPPRLSFQPIFYPVLNKEYATKIAKDWNTKDINSGYVGYVLEFNIDDNYISKFEIQKVGGNGIEEFWIPAEELEEFNSFIIAKIKLLETYKLDK